MFKIYKSLTSALVLIGFISTANAQATDFASTTAILVTPISIVKDIDMHFGTLAASTASGTATLNYANGVTPALGVSVIDATLATTAQFTVTGAADESISITIPTAAITLTGSVAGTMTVDNFVCDAGATTDLDGGGLATLKIGAILHVAANAVAGTYTNANQLIVTVNYN